MSLCAIPVFCMAVVETPVGYIIERLFIGCSLAAFVICQFWSSIMFSPTVVGLANAVAGGWGNAGKPAPPPTPASAQLLIRCRDKTCPPVCICHPVPVSEYARKCNVPCALTVRLCDADNLFFPPWVGFCCEGRQ